MNTKIFSVLLIEDDDDHYKIIDRMARNDPAQTLMIIRESTLAAGLKRSENGDIDAILLDLRLPDSSGIPTLKKALVRLPKSMPIVVLTSLDDQELALEAIRSGAQDFLCKGLLTPSILSNAVRNSIERKRTDRILEENVRRIEMTQMAARIASWEWNLETNETYWSGDYLGLFGFTDAKSMDRKTWMAHVHPDDVENLNLAIARGLESGLFDYEFRFLRADGACSWIGAKGMTFNETEGRPSRMLGINWDLTERKNREELARKQDEIIRTITDNAVSGLFLVDEFSFVTYVNPAAIEMTGFSQKEFIGNSLSITLNEDSESSQKKASAWESVTKAILTQQSMRAFELSVIRADGRLLPVSVSVAPLSDVSGRGTGAVIEMQDVTRWKLIEGDLILAKEAAESGNRSRLNFLANMSHEIRTPLGSVLGYSELIIRDDVSREDKINYAQNIKKNGQEVVSIVDDLLDLSKLATSRMEVERRAFDLNGFLSEIFQLLQPKAKAKGLSLQFESRGKVPDKLNSDRSRLKQILLAMLGNAIKFTSVGAVTLIIRASGNRNHSTHQFYFEISDTGLGINASKVDYLFEPFTQEDESATRRYGGTGLGLALSRSLARLLGGDVMLKESVVGRGSTFLITIESVDPKGDLSSSADRVEERAIDFRWESASLPLDKLDILVVEDSLDTQLIVKRVLEFAGAQVLTADNGKHALDLVHEHGTFDLILMDLQMPIMDGFQALGHLRSQGYFAPVVAFTAHALKADRDRCLAAGFNEHTTKPMIHDKLIALIAEQARRDVSH